MLLLQPPPSQYQLRETLQTNPWDYDLAPAVFQLAINSVQFHFFRPVSSKPWPSHCRHSRSIPISRGTCNRQAPANRACQKSFLIYHSILNICPTTLVTNKTFTFLPSVWQQLLQGPWVISCYKAS